MRPILYSFRRCPYAMRARLALYVAKQQVELREVALRDKPTAFLAASASGTIPCLVTDEGAIDESLDIMIWALRRNDPQYWLDMPEAGWDWIAKGDGPFKKALDQTKYASRYPDQDPEVSRAKAAAFLTDLDQQLRQDPGGWIFARPTLADFALLPFVRQFAFIDKNWFDAQAWPDLQGWLQRFLESEVFAEIMPKFAQWKDGDHPTPFPNSMPD
ncbi:hypothetical protein RSK20926_22269 [Roseobacter sp. SK209-2-6]|uniref:glutathione S-transferase n=1 Tax=Roseobacter sp. SK209-2-6 TaxID=388739 RepID=UPI0000F3F1D4|nr:glutathione S-transferase [Roseobacter sp. SK209-2-6]EBA16497.1 hypothetical protein RSK20926_22269 [Roseobacter sp. SK209-2-6]